MESNRYDKGIEVLQRMVSEETLNATVKKWRNSVLTWPS